VSYLEKWAYPFQPHISFQWIKSKAPPTWDEVAGTLKIIKAVNRCG
jgi:hypothetical protein